MKAFLRNMNLPKKEHSHEQRRENFRACLKIAEMTDMILEAMQSQIANAQGQMAMQVIHPLDPLLQLGDGIDKLYHFDG